MDSLRAERHFVALVAIVAVIRFVVPPGRVPGTEETWLTVAVLWALGIIWFAVRAPRGRLVGESVGDVGAQNLAIQALITLPSVAVGVVRLAEGSGTPAFSANAFVTVAFVPLGSLVIFTLGALPVLWLCLQLRRLVGLGAILLFVAQPVSAQVCPSTTTLALDHVVLAVPDLAAASEFFANDLGFTLKPGRLHGNSILNSHAKFADGTELELLTASEPLDAVAAQYLDFLADGPGFAYVAFRGPDLRAAAERLPDSELVTGRAFDWLAFPSSHRWHHLFLISVHALPNDPAELFEHANSASGLIGVDLASPDGEEHDFFEAFGAQACDVEPARARIGLDGGEVALLVGPGSAGTRRVAGVTLRVADVDAAADLLARHGGERFDLPRERGVMLRHELLGGAWLRFVAAVE